MPTYQYKCTDCGIDSEVVRGIRDSAPDPLCHICNLSLKRVYSNIGVTFNGSGFYRTDSRG
jgi:putative FmdB family regulatory protein